MNKLSELLKKKMKVDKMSLREAADEIGVSHSTVDRAIKGKTVEVDTLVKISEFVGVPVESVFDVRTDSDEVLEQIVMMTSMEPELMKIFAEIAEDVLTGKIDKSVLGEVAAFASYRLQVNREDKPAKKKQEVSKVS